jgi:N-acetylglucosamine kinase-like BadF-type ATPase
VFLGVDSGGTKTAFCLVNADGEVAACTTTASAGALTDVEAIAGILAAGVATVCDQAGITARDIEQAFFGLPGYGESSRIDPVLDELPRQVLGHDRYSCDNDMVCAWAGSLALADGINVISGTGSMAYGERAGSRARAGGWGELFGDEGSAHWIAVRGLAAFSRMSDGRQARGPLHQLLQRRLGTATELDVLDLVLNQWHADRARVAALCPVVAEAASSGDACAVAILEDAGTELALVADAARQRLGFLSGDVVPVSYSGGVFSVPRVLDAFRRALASGEVGYRLQTPVCPPAVGAALYAAQRAGAPLAPAAVTRLQRQLAA